MSERKNRRLATRSLCPCGRELRTTPSICAYPPFTSSCIGGALDFVGKQHDMVTRLGMPVTAAGRGRRGGEKRLDGVHDENLFCRRAAVYAARMNSATRSPIIMVGILVLALTIDGMTDASATRRPSTA
jgi:hypothetical protein